MSEKVKPMLWTLKCGCEVYYDGESFIINEFCGDDNIRAVAAMAGIKPREATE